MAQNDMNVANQGFPAFRADLNDQLEALVTNSSGATAPATTFPHQWWLDTSTTPNTLRQRNAANDAWIVIGLVNQSANKFILSNPEYTGTLTGGPGVINIGSGQLYKDASGNVGIGTSSPVTMLDVIAANPTRGILGRIRNSGTSGQTGSQVELSQAGIQNWAFGMPAANNDFVFWSGRSTFADGTERLRIESAGKIKAATGGGWVGTVSQNGLSSVIERGSNVNGEFVKFADGTMICHGAKQNLFGTITSPFAATGTTITMPASFVSAASTFFDINLGPNNFAMYIEKKYMSSTSAGFFSVRKDSSFTSADWQVVSYSAIGRWY